MGLIQEHRAFKENAVRELHEWADRARHCHVFDQVMHRGGLPARPRFYEDRTSLKPPKIVGERTEEKFQAWRRKASILAHEAARDNSFNRLEYDDVIRRAGLISYNELYPVTKVTVSGSFSVDFETRVFDGKPVTESVIAQHLLAAYNRGEIKYTVTTRT